MSAPNPVPSLAIFNRALTVNFSQAPKNHAMLLRIAMKQLAGQYLMPTQVSPNWPRMGYFEAVMMPDVD